MIAAEPSRTSAPSWALSLPEHDDHHPREGGDGTADRAPSDMLAEEDCSEHEGQERSDEGERNCLGERHAADPPEEEKGHHRDEHAAPDMDSKRGPIWPTFLAGEVEERADHEIDKGPPDADRDDPDREHKVLHHRVHDRQQSNRDERGCKCFGGLLRDAVHAPPLAAYGCASRGVAGAGALSMSSGG